MGSFAGALIDRDAHEVTLGGLGGANLGFLTGWGLLKAEVVEPRDFGWLSAFGAAGTVVGGGVGALFSTRENSRPALAGLLIGPAVGLTAGAVVLPHLNRLLAGRSDGLPLAAASPPAPPAARSRRPPGHQPPPAEAPDGDRQATSADLDDARRARHAGPGLGKRLHQAFRPTQVMPVIGALPSTPDGPPGPPPFLFGLAGLWR
jgi:hypothetical protein